MKTNIPRDKKYYPRKWNITRGNKIFPAEMKCKNIPHDPKIFVAPNPRGREIIPRGKIIPRGPENIPRGKISPAAQKLFSAAQKIFPAEKNIPRGRENIPRGPENIPRGKNIPRGRENIPRGKKIFIHMSLPGFRR